jgi:hypothetical protein
MIFNTLDGKRDRLYEREERKINMRKKIRVREGIERESDNTYMERGGMEMEMERHEMRDKKSSRK